MKVSSRRGVVRLPMRMCGCCANVGDCRRSSSVRRVQVQLGGQTAPILCRARLRRSVSTPTPSLATLLTVFSPGDKKPRDSPGRSILRPSKLVSCSDDYYTPDDQERRRHEKLSSERLTGALLDRLTHHVHILEM